MRMTQTNRITVSSFEMKRKKFVFFVHICFCFSQQTISHSDNEERRNLQPHQLRAKNHIHQHAAQAKRDQSKTTHTKIQKISNATSLYRKTRFLSLYSNIYTKHVLVHHKGHFRNILQGFLFACCRRHCCCFYNDNDMFFGLPERESKEQKQKVIQQLQ